MRMTRSFLKMPVVLIFLVLGSIAAFSAEHTKDFDKLPEKGMVTMIDLGAKKCIPCKMMEPILLKVEKEVKGKAAVIFIDVWKHRGQANRFKIRGIPTQIFFNKQGEEVYRHMGFLSEKDIKAQFKKMGVPI